MLPPDPVSLYNKRMYFVHPQIKLNGKNFLKIFSCFFRKPDLKNKLSFYFPKKQIVFTDMGRTAFKIIIEKLNLENSEMLVPAYICDIFYPIFKKYNISPIFLDIEPFSFNIKIEEIERKITPKTKSILISHTYGLANNMEKILFLAKKYNLKVIEDCSHSFLGKYKEKYLGNFGDVSFISLYKQFPTLRGGMLICPLDWEIDLEKTFFSFRDFISFLNCFSFFANFFKKYGGEIAYKMLKKEKKERFSEINNVSLNLFSTFLENFEKNLTKRIELALFFQEELKKLNFEVQEEKNNVFCYLSVLAPKKLNRDNFVKLLRKDKIFATRIWHTPIILNPEVQKEYKINLSEYPQTIELAKRIVNFPLQNFYSKKDIEKLIKKIKNTIDKSFLIC